MTDYDHLQAQELGQYRRMQAPQCATTTRESPVKAAIGNLSAINKKLLDGLSRLNSRLGVLLGPEQPHEHAPTDGEPRTGLPSCELISAIRQEIATAHQVSAGIESILARLEI